MGIAYSGEGFDMPSCCGSSRCCSRIVATAATITPGLTAAGSIAYSRAEGGTSTDLDSFTTSGAQNNIYAWVITDAGVPSLWVLRTGTAATDVLSGILRPQDYTALNTRNWIRIL